MRRIPKEESLAHLGTRTGAPQTPGPKAAAETATADEAAPKLSEKFETRLPRYRMDQVILSDLVSAEIKVLQSRIRNHDLIYQDWGFAEVDPLGRNIAVNFYGPPGTGKTMCAEALASELGKSILEVNYAEIESKYVGDTPKNIVAAFRCATETDSVLFFDEADSILGRRLTSVTQSADHGVNVSRSVMLKQLDDFSGIVIFATNLARNFDSAFVRRILQHVFIAPPDEKCRVRLWQKIVTAAIPGRANLDFTRLAAESDGLTGGLIKNATLLALADLAQRPVLTRQLVHDDLAKGIEHVRRAQLEIGAEHASEPKVTWKELAGNPLACASNQTGETPSRSP